MLKRVAGIIATVFGVLFLLNLLAWCTLVKDDLNGAAWWAVVLGKMVSDGNIVGTVIGVVCVAGGLFLLFLPARLGRTPIPLVVMAALGGLIFVAMFMSFAFL
jgi:hypothetical protein